MHAVYIHGADGEAAACSVRDAAGGGHSIRLALAGFEAFLILQDREAMRRTCLLFHRVTEEWLAAETDRQRREGDGHEPERKIPAPGICPDCGSRSTSLYCADGHKPTPRVPAATVERVDAALGRIRAAVEDHDGNV